MSKLLAMMMKPKNYMYATIKGSLTENPTGVFSNFSASNYLLIDQTFSLTNNIVEFVFNVFLPTDNTKANACFFSFSPDNKRVQFYRSSVNLNYFVINIAGQSGSGTHQYALNANHKIKTVISTTTVKIYYYDNNQWNFDVEYNIANSSISNVRIGNSQTGDRYFYGSINLNSSYAKIGNTKYQIQAVVGYTKIGNPTITDGVVSGFSASNYLALQQPFVLNADTVAEFTIKINVNILNNNSSILGTPNYYGLALTLQTNGKLLLNYGIGSNWTININGSNILSANTDYYIRLNINKGSVIISHSTDNINYTEDISTTINFTEQSLSLCYGIGRVTTNYLRGSIDLNETYIKTDGKLWFNGQPAS